MSLVDLHTHSTESDGTFTPEELVTAAVRAGIGTLAITDHDQVTLAASNGIELIQGIELTCKYDASNVHLLGYFFDREPAPEFDVWMKGLLEARRDRNRRLASRLQELGLDIQLDEVEKYGRRMTGRPHFARVLVDKGYATTAREAFDRYIGEGGGAYVERDSPGIAEAIERITAAGGLTSLAHPFRIRAELDKAVGEFAAAGLGAIEAFHSDHSAANTKHYLSLAEKYGLAVSGGSDFHGANKPDIQLGRGIGGNLHVPEWVVPALRARSRRTSPA